MTLPPAWTPIVILAVAGVSTAWRLVQLRLGGVNALVVEGGNDLRALLEKLFGVIIVATALFAVAFAFRPPS